MKHDWWAGTTFRQWYLRDHRIAYLTLNLSTNMITVATDPGGNEVLGMLTMESFIRNDEPENTAVITTMWDTRHLIRPEKKNPNVAGVITRLVEICKERVA